MEFITDLFEHQKRCVEKLRKIKIGALYLEMGTGKTRTALELIKIRLEKGRINHVLWLCPCSVKETLTRDIIKHTGNHCKDFITVCGIETLSSSIRTNARLLQLVEDKECYLIVDESNLVKNFYAKRTKNIINLAEKCKYKLILNGTPISKNETDLFAQWYILDWRVLGYKSYWSFAANHIEYDENVRGKLRRVLNVDYLIEKIAPYSYQVKKEECLDLPEKTYSTKYFYLSDLQMKYYCETLDTFLNDVDEFDETTIYRLFSALQTVISGRKIISNIKEPIKSKNIFKNILDNPRMQTLMDLIDKDYKTIIFCKYTSEIKDICKVINDKHGSDTAIPFFGELNLKQREKNLEKFRNESTFLVANKTCAGYGLNLQFCNYVIYYSNDWDYATRAQSEDRVHRIGQNNNVHIVDLCAIDTLDERILDCLMRKEKLVDCLKSELENQKDIKSTLESWLRVKDSRGKNRSRKMKTLDKSDLIINEEYKIN